jgi:hypothetical protein
MKQIAVRPTRELRNEEFAKHINGRHLVGDGRIYPQHFDFIYGLETIWRGWHALDHKQFGDELDHYHTEGRQGRP